MIVITYAQYDENLLDDFAPNVVHVDAGNRQVDVTALEGVFPVSWEQ